MTTPQSRVGRSLVFDARGRSQLFRRKGLVLCAGVLGCVVGMPVAEAHQDGAAAQPAGAGTGVNAGSSRSGPAAPEQRDPMGLHVEHQMAERRNEDRQKELVADTDKLLSLAQALKEEVDKSNKDQLSVDVVKRAEQIEKLARSVKDKMKGY